MNNAQKASNHLQLARDLVDGAPEVIYDPPNGETRAIDMLKLQLAVALGSALVNAILAVAEAIEVKRV